MWSQISHSLWLYVMYAVNCSTVNFCLLHPVTLSYQSLDIRRPGRWMASSSWLGLPTLLLTAVSLHLWGSYCSAFLGSFICQKYTCHPTQTFPFNSCSKHWMDLYLFHSSHTWFLHQPTHVSVDCLQSANPPNNPAISHRHSLSPHIDFSV